ncbi:methytransferase partner Trm112 [Methanosarcina sp. KYL-1]|uniref:methytransferase partner Trm112 n=1 Tax=Methanosarcina sp. KYL-1 TaxID=2602068 RepID=UPI002100F71F|nr:methytransferase partner Trm112 [Methanosarcina sp. KYL-1]
MEFPFPYLTSGFDGDYRVKKDLMDILACPICKGDLVLNVVEENEEEVISGTLYCPVCKEHYPIDEGIPNLLPPDMRN